MMNPRTARSSTGTPDLRRLFAPFGLGLSFLFVALTGCSGEVDAGNGDPPPVVISGTGGVGGAASGGRPPTAASAGMAAGGAMAATCAPPQLACAGACVNPQSDARNCGACGNACVNGQSCVAGTCRADGETCSPGRQVCSGMCVDLQTDANHCGNCATACTGSRVCVAGACTCASGSLSCGGVCADPMTSAEHCGACNNACTDGKTCQGGTCACAPGKQACGQTCVDLQTDNANCGSCGKACTSGSTCVAGQCACAMGQTLCGEACADLQTSAQNCGACGKSCGLGQSCVAGACSSGGGGNLLEDGCQGLAQGVSVEEVSVYQTVKIPIVEDGAAVNGDDRNADVVAGRDALFRIFVSVGSGFTARSMSARLFLENAGTVTTLYSDEKPMISKSSAEEELGTTFQIEVPKEAIKPDTRFAVEVVECGGTGSGGMQSPRFPDSEGAALGAVETGPLKIHFVPIKVNSLVPETTEQALAPYKEYFLATYPITDVIFEVGEELQASSANWTAMLDSVRSRRQSDRPAADVYYYGLVKPRATLREYCMQSCTTGIGYVPQGSSNQQSGQRVAVGIAFSDKVSSETMLHEVGHNHGRLHTNCGGPDSPDPNYPYARGEVGVYGFDSRSQTILGTDRTDIMGYCNNKWFSDYTYQALLERGRTVNSVQSVVVAPGALSKFRVLLVDSGTAWWGHPIDEPSLPAGVAEEAEIFDANGQPIATATVYRTPIADADAYSFEVPLPEAGWYAVRVDGAPLLAF